MLAWIAHEEFALCNASGAEGVGLDDIRACLQEPAMDVSNHPWLGQREKIAVVKKAFLCVLESFAADVALFHPIGADRRPHRPVNDGDAMFEDLFQGMNSALIHILNLSAWGKLAISSQL